MPHGANPGFHGFRDLTCRRYLSTCRKNLAGYLNISLYLRSFFRTGFLREENRPESYHEHVPCHLMPGPGLQGRRAHHPEVGEETRRLVPIGSAAVPPLIAGIGV